MSSATIQAVLSSLFTTPSEPEEGVFILDFTDNTGLYQTTDTSTPVTTAGQNVQRIDKDGVVATIVGGTAVWQTTGIVTSGSVRFDVTTPFELQGAVVACTPSTGDTGFNHGVLGGPTNYLMINSGLYRWRTNTDSDTSVVESRTGMQIAAFELDEGTGLVRAWMDGAEGETETLKSSLLIERFFHRATTVSYVGTVAYMALSSTPLSVIDRRLHIKTAADLTWTLPANRIMIMGDDTPFNVYVQGTDDPEQPFLVSHHGVSGQTLNEGTEGTYGTTRIDASSFASEWGLQAFSPSFDATRFGDDEDYQLGGYPSGRQTANHEADLLYNIRAHLEQPDKLALIYGFGEGGEYLSRVAAYAPASNVQKYVITSPSTWVVPIRTATGTFTTATAPYGFAGLGLSAGDADNMIRAYLQLPITIYVGGDDDNASDPTLGDPTNTLGQGAHRLERAQNVFAIAETQAAALGVTLNWQLVIANGVGHSGANMLNSSDAEEAFFGPTPESFKVWISADGARDHDDNVAIMVGVAQAMKVMSEDSAFELSGVVFGDTLDGSQYRMLHPTGSLPGWITPNSLFNNTDGNRRGAGNLEFFRDYAGPAFEALQIPIYNLVDEDDDGQRPWEFDATNLNEITSASQALVADVLEAMSSVNAKVVYSAGGGANVPAEAIGYLLNQGYVKADIIPYLAVVQHGSNNWVRQQEPLTRTLTCEFTIAVTTQGRTEYDNGWIGPGLEVTIENTNNADGSIYGPLFDEALQVAIGEQAFGPGLPSHATFTGTDDGSDCGSHAFAFDSTAVNLHWDDDRMITGDNLDEGSDYLINAASGPDRTRNLYNSFTPSDVTILLNGTGSAALLALLDERLNG